MRLQILNLLGLLPLALGEVFDLSQLSWSLSNQNGTIVIPASIPSQVHLDLLEAGVITEPLLGINDFAERWIINDNWTYTADLSPILKATSKAKTSSLLAFYGLDTVANITLFGKPVAWVNNQFRQYVYDVSDILAKVSPGNTNLTVAFESAWLYGLNVTSRPDAEAFPVTSVSLTTINFEYPGVRQWIRKTQSDFGWDWGPAFVPIGIFKPAYLITLSDSKDNIGNTHADAIFLEEKTLEVYKPGQTLANRPDESADWIVNVTLGLRSAVAFSAPSLTIAFPELEYTTNVRIPSIERSLDTEHVVSASVRIPEGLPQRWYTHNLATGPKLYDVKITLAASSTYKVSWDTTTGFRTIFLAQGPYSQEDIDKRGITPGNQWHFELNGEAFYALGTNIIPFDPFYARVTTDKVRWVLESAVASGQNMVRVWGGGIYQPSASSPGVYDFYDLCDELGILAWSELIFSDSLYPINDFMLGSIEPEVRQNVRRVKRNPSNAQWAGGNENELLAIFVNETLANGTHYLDEYVFLAQDYLQGIVTSETNSVAYTDCSTTFGPLSFDPLVQRFLNGTPGFIYGNTERYNYDASQAFNYSTYPVARFVNEFGFHSMPSFYSWEEVLTSPEDFSFNSTVVASRDHHLPAGDLTFPNPNAVLGQAQMTSGVELWLPTPGTEDSNQTFAQWCWSTQIFQSMTMASQIAWYRRGAGLGENNLGALVWQNNDIWQGVSWSAVEYSGRWKVLNYGLATAFSSVVINAFWTPDNQTLEVLVTSDRWEAVKGTAELSWYTWNGTLLSNNTVHFTTPALNNSVVFSGTGLDQILPPGSDPKDVWLRMNLIAVADKRIVTNEQFFTPVSLADANLVDPLISVIRGKDLTFTLRAAGGVAPWTWIDHPAGTVGYFIDAITHLPSNGFYLVPGQDRTIKFILNQSMSRSASPNPADFVVRSLWNNTHVA
ncbi:glycoside hydrolase family 2 protein [Punctularia strigosozonata HHB-11173 SS5]|uniref:glycoside hydrolase family 2 protein n=1 Tax=Punctularia strigosozonata (strain HHB-11173) TaxID=741275 RepID=UPI00044169C3|nr:glycoside hydrolase family 2 protein [Punctularia strigosozonata HHB-11173 SS5]EIN11243.1 glycoside hydrolase family 2 protein [Punctularia strigosozonata HHB-11173 SS5]